MCEYRYNGIQKFKINIKEQFFEEIEAFKENIDEKLTTPASSQLFTLSEQAYQLDEENSEIFHSLVVKILYIMRRARPYLETVISFLFRRL